jgi:hypothetical protein
MNQFFENLKHQAEANPLMALIIGTALLNGAARFVDASGAAVGRRAYARQIDNKIKNQ